jgi:hypothetical protein
VPRKPKAPCKYPMCPRFAVTDGYCGQHALFAAQERKPDRRPPSSKRGYNANWRRIRERILKEAGIPKNEWHLYDVDHNPPYNPDIEPDHNRYELIPRLHGQHSSKTAKYDGGFGNARIGRGGSNLYSLKQQNRVCYQTHTHCVVIQGGRDGRS